MLDPQFRTSEEHPAYIHAFPPTYCCNEDILRLPVPRYIPTREPASNLNKGQGSRKPHHSRTGTQVVDIDLFPHRLNWVPYASRTTLPAPDSPSTPRTGSDLVQSSPKGTSYLQRLSRALLPRPYSGGEEVVSRPETEGSRVPENIHLVRRREFPLPHYPRPSRLLFLELHSAEVRRFLTPRQRD
jgi:hypothetical protein